MRKELYIRIYLGILIIFISTAFLFFMLYCTLPQKEEYDKAVLDTKSHLLAKQKDAEEIAKIQMEITLQQYERSGNFNSIYSYSLRLHEAVFLGDSISEGLVSYGLLKQTQCVGKRGARIDLFEEQYNQIKGRKSIKYFFLQFGLNDAKYWNSDQAFIDCYREKIQKIKKDYPDAQIYVNRLLPVSSKVLVNEPAFQRIPSMNALLENMCKEEEIFCIDPSIFLSVEDTYEYDGIHPTYPFYEKWLSYMAWRIGV